MLQSNILIRDLVNYVQDAGLCKEKDDAFQQELYDGIIECEDDAFKLTAEAKSPRIAHPGPLKQAIRFVLERNANIKEIKFPKM